MFDTFLFMLYKLVVLMVDKIVNVVVAVAAVLLLLCCCASVPSPASQSVNVR